MRTHTKDTQSSITPATALEYLQEGNQRFQMNLKANRDLLEQVNETRDGQFPFATILSCIDSRVSAELVFDQGLGDIFSIRIAGNFINEDILGSMEFACKIAGSKLIVVLGHTGCGAIKGVCDNVRMGNLTTVMTKLRGALDETEDPTEDRSSANASFVNKVAETNVKHTMEGISQRSTILRDMMDEGTIRLVGGMYDVNTGKVEFYE
ncbi:MAG: carbonic anhydrase [Candidatus Latescibacteria bacterium]|jgi:carbonic anhydrase|nr:carbonic anhydrase [Candidatus Latescibacterota bacterium]